MLEVSLWIILGLLLLGLEVFIVSFGFLTLAAIFCFYWANQLLQQDVVEVESWRVEVLSGIIVSGLFFLGYLVYGSWKLKRRRKDIKVDHAKVIYLDSPTKGQVDWNGERWAFRCDQPVQLGDTVFIEKIDGLLLYVSK